MICFWWKILFYFFLSINYFFLVEFCFIIFHVMFVAVTAISSPGCEYQFGIYPHTAECSTHYIKCAHGEPLPNECEPGLVYDDRIHGCNWPDLLPETCNPEGKSGETVAHPTGAPFKYKSCIARTSAFGNCCKMMATFLCSIK